MAKVVNQEPIDMAPNDTELERNILGAVLLSTDNFDLIRFLEPDDFYSDKHRVLYEAMVVIDQKDAVINAISLTDHIELMQRADCFPYNSPSSYIVELLNAASAWESATYISREAESNARRLQEISVCRTLYLGSGQLAATAYSKNAEDALVSLEELAQSVRKKSSGADLTSVGSLLGDYMDRLDHLHLHRGQVVGIPTGLTDLDRLTGGFQRSDLIVLAARPAVGKTSMCLTIARNAAKKGHGVAVFSLEMSQEQLIQRLVSMEAGIDQQKLRTGWIEDDEWERIIDTMGRLNEMPLYIDDTPGITCAEIRSKVRRLMASGQQIDMVIVDYLQLMQAYVGSTSGKKSDNRVQEVSEISRQLKGMARELDVPVLALAQLSRAVESRQSKIPQLSDLRESGSIEQDSDIVMFIYRDDVYNPDSERANTADIIVAKHRNGPVGEVSLFFKKSHTTFTDIEVVSDEHKETSAETEEEDY